MSRLARCWCEINAPGTSKVSPCLLVGAYWPLGRILHSGFVKIRISCPSQVVWNHIAARDYARISLPSHEWRLAAVGEAAATGFSWVH